MFPHRFIPGPWSSCSTSCGLGFQKRWVKCRVLLTFTRAEVDLPDEECDEDKPPVQRLCELEPCTGSPAPPQGRDGQHGPQWGYRKFSPCSKSCGGGERKSFRHQEQHSPQHTAPHHTAPTPHPTSTPSSSKNRLRPYVGQLS